MRSFFVSEDAPVGAVLVLPASDDGLDKDRVRVLADRGVAAMSVEWSAGPLSDLAPALNELARYSEHVGLLGVSDGVEVALHLARDPRVHVVATLERPGSAVVTAEPMRAHVIRGTDPAGVLEALLRALAEPPSAEPPPPRPFPAPRGPR